MAKTKTRTRRPRTQHLPGMEPPSIKAIDTAAGEYVDLRDNRMRLLKEEVDAHDKLLILMKSNGLTSYEFDGFTVNIQGTEKVKVKRKGETEE